MATDPNWQWFVQRTVSDVAVQWVNVNDRSQSYGGSCRYGMSDRLRYVNFVDALRRQLAEDGRDISPERFAAFEDAFMATCGSVAE